MKQKTILQWLNELPELIRELAIADYVCNQTYSDATYSKMSNAIMDYSWLKSSIDIELLVCIHADALYHEQHNLKLPK